MKTAAAFSWQPFCLSRRKNLDATMCLAVPASMATAAVKSTTSVETAAPP